MTTFMLKLGPAIEVLAELANDRQACHAKAAAWARTVLESLRRAPCSRGRGGGFRADMSAIVQLALTYLGVMDCTSDVERAFAGLPDRRGLRAELSLARGVIAAGQGAGRGGACSPPRGGFGGAPAAG